MVQTDALVADVELEGYGRFIRLVLGTTEIAGQMSPGQFVLADFGGFLREPLFPARISAQSFDVLVPPSHPAAGLTAGASLSLVGPLGRGFSVMSTARRLLLVASPHRLPALLPLTETAFTWSRSIALLFAAGPSDSPYPLQLLPSSLEVHFAVPDDPTIGQVAQGSVWSDLVSWADHVLAAACEATYATLARLVRDCRMAPNPGFAQALLAPEMACGVGACRGCGVATESGVKLACRDGPVFDLLELRWP